MTAVLINKIPRDQKPAWSPATIDEVTPDIISRFFNQNSDYLKATPQLSVPRDLAVAMKDPMRFALPTELAIAKCFRIKGTESAIIALPELLQHFDGVDALRPGKQGAREKVLEVVHRRCEFVDLDDGKARYWIRWVE